MTIDSRAFRNALGLFPTGVAIVTTLAPDGERIGATVSSFNSVSLDPPLILFSIACSAKAYDTWAGAKHYAVNILSEAQSDVSNRFARALTDKWDGMAEMTGANGLPLIPHASACFECEDYAKHDGGDHLILVGRVMSYTTTSSSNPRPLLFYRGRYREIDPDLAIDTPQGVDHLLHGW
ncbi:flavin reductase family protein [Bradyrhizobium sp. CCGUVB1N3]|uniref:flavin reductase family protein n=1 Tax=Bradyrhizobium sp. CCGUVB1N3 TaxID=2949629 RepID=UPI0020B2BCD0|nr:flavin reductase family protein [Bradyrhizobium sp. CCGUVB1N3]MCP3473318.1 flavin reductase family protein [Bradyrhizobium sp. CCGUVB1N3]